MRNVDDLIARNGVHKLTVIWGYMEPWSVDAARTAVRHPYATLDTSQGTGRKERMVATDICIVSNYDCIKNFANSKLQIHMCQLLESDHMDNRE